MPKGGSIGSVFKRFEHSLIEFKGGEQNIYFLPKWQISESVIIECHNELPKTMIKQRSKELSKEPQEFQVLVLAVLMFDMRTFVLHRICHPFEKISLHALFTQIIISKRSGRLVSLL